MDWIEKAKLLFNLQKPDHFVDYKHCRECADHDEVLRSFDVNSIGIEQLGNPCWDPICYCSDSGKKYYFPALIRLSLETIDGEFYFRQLIFHINDERFIQSCSIEQKEFVSEFLAHFFNNYISILEKECLVDEAMSVAEKWSDV